MTAYQIDLAKVRERGGEISSLAETTASPSRTTRGRTHKRGSGSIPTTISARRSIAALPLNTQRRLLIPLGTPTVTASPPIPISRSASPARLITVGSPTALSSPASAGSVVRRVSVARLATPASPRFLRAQPPVVTTPATHRPHQPVHESTAVAVGPTKRIMTTVAAIPTTHRVSPPPPPKSRITAKESSSKAAAESPKRDSALPGLKPNPLLLLGMQQQALRKLPVPAPIATSGDVLRKQSAADHVCRLTGLSGGDRSRSPPPATSRQRVIVPADPDLPLGAANAPERYYSVLADDVISLRELVLESCRNSVEPFPFLPPSGRGDSPTARGGLPAIIGMNPKLIRIPHDLELDSISGYIVPLEHPPHSHLLGGNNRGASSRRRRHPPAACVPC